MKKVFAITLSLMLLFLTACTSKLTTVRPSEISELRVERLSDGAIGEFPDKENARNLQESLIFQLEQPYNSTGRCKDSDGHKYKVTLFICETIDTEVILNEDQSVCKEGSRYVASEKADNPVKLADWDMLFTEKKAAGTEEIDLPMDIVSCKGDPMELPQEAEILQSAPVAEDLPWSYYIGDVRFDGQEFVMVWRDNPKGDAQWLCSIPQYAGDDSLRHAVEYAEGSFESSGEKFLYFTIQDAATFHRSLWCFDPKSEYFDMLLEAPCSNMVILADEPKDAQHIGWIVYDHYLAAVDLANGEAFTSMSIDLDGHVKDSLFYGIDSFGTHKYVRLSDAGSNDVEIESITSEPATSAPEQRTAYRVNLTRVAFAAALHPLWRPVLMGNDCFIRCGKSIKEVTFESHALCVKEGG